MPAALAVRDLRKRYGAIEAVAGVSFDIASGEIFGLLGPNGAGKTTTLECILGLRQPDAGRVVIGGLDAAREPRRVKQRVGAVLQTMALQDHVTPREALALFASFYEQRLAPEQLIARFALGDKADARFASLSCGQQKRLALALAFVNQPELLVLDEPLSGLDPQTRRDLRETIRQLRGDGCAVLLTTHDVDEAGGLCDRVGIINHGRLIATGAPPELIAHAQARRAERGAPAAPDGRPPSLEDVFLELTGGPGGE
jgi:ABC-2 type transport system ATP-binding protein